MTDALRFAPVHVGAQNPVVPNSSADRDERSAVADLVFARIEAAFGGSISKAAAHIGVSPNTIRYLPRQRPEPETLTKLAELAIPREKLEEARALDDARAAGLEFPRDIYDVVVKAMILPPNDRRLLGEIAATIARHRSRQDRDQSD